LAERKATDPFCIAGNYMGEEVGTLGEGRGAKSGDKRTLVGGVVVTTNSRGEGKSEVASII